jgi:hypothetical protein
LIKKEIIQEGGSEMKKQKKLISLFALAFAVVLLLSGSALAGSIEPPSNATDTSGNPVPTMKTLDEVLPAWSQKLRADDGPNGDKCNSSRFKCVLDGEAVLDKETGLVWERTLSDYSSIWSQALYWCNNLSRGGRQGWRLPTVNEIASILDWSVYGLPNGHPFTVVPSRGYWWTATTVGHYWNADTSVDDYTYWAYAVPVLGSVISQSHKYYDQYIWCVRGGGGVAVNE